MKKISESGMGVMLNALMGNRETVKTFTKAKGKKIIALELVEDARGFRHGHGDALRFTFEDGTKMQLRDDGQSCCESRYMMTDDDLSQFIGADLLDAEIRDAPNEPDKYGEHEVQFLVVTTSKGAFTMASHNEHNGYYGGFSIVAEDVPSDQ